MASSSKAPATSTPESPNDFTFKHMRKIRKTFSTALEASIITLASQVEDTARKQGHPPPKSFSVVQQEEDKNSLLLPCLFATGFNALKVIAEGQLVAARKITSLDAFKEWTAERKIPGIYVLEIMTTKEVRLSPKDWSIIASSLETYITPSSCDGPWYEASFESRQRELKDRELINRVDSRFGPSKYYQKYIRDGEGQDINPEKFQTIWDFCDAVHKFNAPFWNTDGWTKQLGLNVLEVGYRTVPTRTSTLASTEHSASHYLTQLIEAAMTDHWPIIMKGTLVMPVYREAQIESARCFIATLSQSRIMFGKTFDAMTGQTSGEDTPSLMHNTKRAIFYESDPCTLITWNREVGKLENSDDLKSTLVNLRRAERRKDQLGELENSDSKATPTNTEREDRHEDQSGELENLVSKITLTNTEREDRHESQSEG